MAKLTHSTDWGMEAVERAAIERGDLDGEPCSDPFASWAVSARLVADKTPNFVADLVERMWLEDQANESERQS